ncbi:MAG: UDP-N-acetylmuramoyl-L-alanyl-D-glutamate--2,6-diaminopimelate ligase [Marinifilaceae bacterium]|nr:UDP-N-acetylmuramoyl-L-alanyl-D-glutamate--2,6-diaminopimelate ligase [Marinifilaceae bacterium]
MFGKLFENIHIIKQEGELTSCIKSIEFDSRKIVDDSLFVAYKGVAVDGHDFIDKAIENGAKLIVCEVLPEELNKDVCYVQVKDSQICLSHLARNFYNKPDTLIKLIGVTGTNGKTSIASFLYDMLMSLGYKTGLLSTIENKINANIYKATHTTGDSIQVCSMLDQMVNEGCEYCFMEVSSHAIDQNRIAALEFEAGIFTNITHDHLDYHKTFKNYINVKKRFFDENIRKTGFAITNIDDKNGNYMMQNTKANIYSYSINSFADYKCKIIERHFNGMQLEIDNSELWVNIIGDFNAYNLSAVYATCINLGFSKEEVLISLSNLKSVNGRFQHIVSPKGVIGVIDYAHTPDALVNILESLNELKTEGKNIITVFGAGGNRDKTKRPEMGKAVCKLTDIAVITSDNPRFEKPEEIIADIYVACKQYEDRIKILKITNREEAIKTAALIANSGDIILIAGKGHETYQDVEGTKHHFDDKEILTKIFNN